MITHVFLDKTSTKPSTSEVTVSDEKVLIRWWYECIKYTGEVDIADYLYASAKLVLGDIQGAIALMQPKATGTLTITEQTIDGEIVQTRTDTRNWYQKWIDENKGV